MASFVDTRQMATRTMASTTSPCADVPIVIRATTLTYVPRSTLRLLPLATREHRVFVVGCWATPLLQLEHGALGIGMGSHPACSAAWR